MIFVKDHEIPQIPTGEISLVHGSGERHGEEMMPISNHGNYTVQKIWDGEPRSGRYQTVPSGRERD